MGDDNVQNACISSQAAVIGELYERWNNLGPEGVLGAIWKLNSYEVSIQQRSQMSNLALRTNRLSTKKRTGE